MSVSARVRAAVASRTGAHGSRLSRLDPLAAAAFVVAAAYLPGIFSSAFMPRWWILAIALPLVSDLDPRNLPPAIGACLLAGLAWAAASLTWAPEPAEGFGDLILLILASLAMLAAAGAEDLDLPISAFGWGIATASAVQAAQVLAGDLLGFQGLEVAPAGTFLNPEPFALAAAPIAAWALQRAAWPLLAAMAVPLALCGSRVALAALAAALLWAWNPRPTILKWATVLGLAVACAGAIVLLGPHRLSTAFSRIILWLAAAESMTPLGRGLGWWAVGHPGASEEFAHSDVLQLAVELGGGALLLLAVPVIVWCKGIGDDAERAAFVCLALEAAVSFPLHLPATAFLAALLAGGMAGRWRRVRRLELARRANALAALRRQRTFATGVARRGAGGAANVALREAPAPHGDPGHGRG